MSGTSLDGLDIAACEFRLTKKWVYRIVSCHTFPYSSEWKEKLGSIHAKDALSFSMLNVEYGHLLGRLTRSFIENSGFHPDLIASHGHTIFHQPGNGLTVQIGAGSAIAAETGIPVVCDFRTGDVALGGQGAPLVPIGDRLLFSEFDACLNLGGFANISYEWNDQRIAFDICPANIILNRLVATLGLEYDKDGMIARAGQTDHQLLQKLNALSFYGQPFPKSLGREWMEQVFLPVINEGDINVYDLMRTAYDHIAYQVNNSLQFNKNCKILVTGGGAHNKFLLELIRSHGNHQWITPSKELADFKEALVFAFLGVLRWNGRVNILGSVTGSKIDHSGGVICIP